MAVIRRIARLSRPVQFSLVAVAAFAIGSATVATAATAGIPIGSLFYLPTINGSPTMPCNSVQGLNGPTTTCNAVVDSDGNLHVSTTGTSTVSGTVSVNNFPTDQQVHGTVSVPTDVQIHGSVNVGNFPGTQNVSGTVNVGNFPGTQSVSGTVNVGNLTTDGSGNLKVAPQGTQNVNIVGGNTSALPIATKGMVIEGGLGPGPSSTSVTVNMKVTYLHTEGCSGWVFHLTGGGFLLVHGDHDLIFPLPLDITSVDYDNQDQISGCIPTTNLVGY